MQGPFDGIYVRPIVTGGRSGRSHAVAGGWRRFAEVELLRRGRPAERLPAEAAAALYPEAANAIERVAAPRAPVAGLTLDRPRVMGVLNVTPDSFSDGGLHQAADRAVRHGLEMADQGADLIDIGGESTRPGAEPVGLQQELDRVMPVIEGLVASGLGVPISIDTRKARVARAALEAGAAIFNDVSALSHDSESLSVARAAPAVCLMHAQGDPRTMQENPRYDDVVLDVYDYLEQRLAVAEAAGLPRARCLVDPGIGFGKTLAHNLALIRGLGLLHGLGAPILFGASRKRFIGALSGEAEAARRAPGSIAAALFAASQGAQILRVHDVAETVQALAVWQGIAGEGDHGDVA